MSSLLNRDFKNEVIPGGILLIDSGLGSLPIIQELRKQLPEVPITAVADKQFFPYGNKESLRLIDRMVYLLDWLFVEIQPSLLVVACNTASTIILPELRQRYSVPVVGVVPPVKPAALAGHKSIGILATPATVSREYVDQLIEDFAGDCHVFRFACPRLAELAEQKIISSLAVSELHIELEELLNHPKIADIHALVLGCTHFSLIYEDIQQLFKDKKIYEPSVAVARQIIRLYSNSVISNQGTLLITGNFSFYPYKVLAEFGINQQFHL